jgi:nitrate/nitrite transport system ATP-binding protein
MDEPLSALDAITRGSLQNEIVNIWGQSKTTALLITNDVDEGILMADRIIPLDPGPNATLGPVFPIDIDRPRDKTKMNDDPRFKQVRNQIIEYLLDMGSGTKRTESPTYFLPDIAPVMPGSSYKKLKSA